ncbi:RrF2 family transcriptional regulator [Patescibacteria group bacterium]
MRLTRTEDTAILFVCDLAKRDSNPEPLSLSVFASEHGLSASYLKKIARLLVKHNIIKAKEGAGGGYLLAKKINQIDVKQILDSVEHLDAEISDDFDKNTICPLICDCLPQKIRNTVTKEVDKKLSQIKLKDLL